MVKVVADYLEHLINTEVQLNSLAAEQVLEAALDYLRTIQGLKGRRIVTTSKVPILHRKKVFTLLKPYEGLTEAVLLVSDAFDRTVGELNNVQKNQLCDLIHLYYKTQLGLDCVLYFFDEEINKVSGFFALFQAENIYLLPFNLNDKDFYQTLY